MPDLESEDRPAEDRAINFGRVSITGPRGRFEDFVTRALDAVPDAVSIDSLEVPIRHNANLEPHGSFSYTAIRIEIRIKGTPTPTLTVLHELGHALDYVRFGDGRQFASDQEAPRLHEVMAAIRATRLYSELNDDLATARLLRHPNADELSRILKSRELFARAFAQWVASACDDQLPKRELRYRQQPGKREPMDASDGSLYRDHWTDADFAPVRDALNRLFS